MKKINFEKWNDKWKKLILKNEMINEKNEFSHDWKNLKCFANIQQNFM